MTQTILIVGVSSPIGRTLVQHLARGTARVIGTSRRAYDETLQLDIGDSARMRKLVKTLSPDSIMFLASPADPVRGRSNLLLALERLVAEANDAGVRRIVFASSAAVYGTTTRIHLHESLPPTPESPYGKLKTEAEEVLAAAATRASVEIVIARIFNVYGSGFETSLINRMRSTDAIPEVLDTARFVRDYVHADDVAHALILALDAPLDSPVTIVNVGTGIGTDNQTLLSHSALSGIPITAPIGYSSTSIADTRKMRELLRLDTACFVSLVNNLRTG